MFTLRLRCNDNRVRFTYIKSSNCLFHMHWLTAVFLKIRCTTAIPSATPPRATWSPTGFNNKVTFCLTHASKVCWILISSVHRSCNTGCNYIQATIWWVTSSWFASVFIAWIMTAGSCISAGCTGWPVYIGWLGAAGFTGNLIRNQFITGASRFFRTVWIDAFRSRLAWDQAQRISKF